MSDSTSSATVPVANRLSAAETTASQRLALPYFRSPGRIAALRATVSAWAGTRWGHAGKRPNEMRCGISGDCLFWVHIFKAIGALPSDLQIPEYRKREAAMDNMLRLRICIESSARALQIFGSATVPACPDFEVGVAAVPTTASETLALPGLLIGDVLLFNNGMSGAHCGLVVKEAPVHFVHLSQNGMNEEPLHQTHWLANLAFVYRLLEVS